MVGRLYLLATFAALIGCLAAISPHNAGQKLKTEGNVTFGGLFSIHERGESSELCGNIKDDVGIQRVEAMMYAVDRINKHEQLLPGIKLGVHILDTCSRDTYALEQSVDFIRGRITTVDISNEFVCNDRKQPTKSIVQPVAGVIGASASTDSIMVANILRLFKIPQISYASTAVELSDKSRYEYFSRVVAPDIYQIKAMVEIVRKLNWSYVCTVGDEGWYGEKGIAEFEKEALPYGICVAKAMKVPRDANDTTFTSIVSEIKSQIVRAKVAVVFLSEENVRRLLRAVIRAHLEHEVQWLASDSWGAKKLPVKDNDMAAEYAITLLPTRAYVSDFNDYFINLNPRNNTRNPWFRKFWNHYFNCSLDSRNDNERTACESRKFDGGFRQEGLVHKVIDGVYALARAIADMCKAFCTNNPWNCSEPWRINPSTCPHLFPPNGSKLLRYIRNVSFTGVSGTTVEFNEYGDSRARYDIFQYQRTPDGTFDYVTIGEWKQSNNPLNPFVLELNQTSIRWPKAGRPLSRCSEPCKIGERTTRQSVEQCCWVCIACMPFEILVNETTCFMCPQGQRPDVNKTACYRLPEVSTEWNSVWALVPICVSAFGILLTVSVFTAFFYHRDLPVIKASGRELCFVMLIGVLLCYAMTFVILATPTVLSCAVFRFGTGISLSLIYAAIFTKTNRLSRIFNRSVRQMMKRPSYTSPRSQVAICACLVLIQVIGDSMWLAMDIPKTENFFPEHRDFIVLKCQLDSVAVAVGFLYNLILMILCTSFAFKVRNVPENFNETKYIAFAMYSNCVLWLGYFAMYFGTRDNFNVLLTSTCLTLSITATTIIACMFMPKFYVIFFHPEKSMRKPSVRVTLTDGSSAREQASDQCFPALSTNDAPSTASIALLITKCERPQTQLCSTTASSRKHSLGCASDTTMNSNDIWLRQPSRKVNDYVPRTSQSRSPMQPPEDVYNLAHTSRLRCNCPSVSERRKSGSSQQLQNLSDSSITKNNDAFS